MSNGKGAYGNLMLDWPSEGDRGSGLWTAERWLKETGSLFQVSWDFIIVIGVDVFSHLPDLQDIVLCDGSNDPGIARVPAEIRNTAGMSTMDELESAKGYQKFWRAVFSVLLGLFFPNTAEVPDIDSTIGAR